MKTGQTQQERKMWQMDGRTAMARSKFNLYGLILHCITVCTLLEVDILKKK